MKNFVERSADSLDERLGRSKYFASDLVARVFHVDDDAADTANFFLHNLHWICASTSAVALLACDAVYNTFFFAYCDRDLSTFLRETLLSLAVVCGGGGTFVVRKLLALFVSHLPAGSTSSRRPEERTATSVGGAVVEEDKAQPRLLVEVEQPGTDHARKVEPAEMNKIASATSSKRPPGGESGTTATSSSSSENYKQLEQPKGQVEDAWRAAKSSATATRLQQSTLFTTTHQQDEQLAWHAKTSRRRKATLKDFEPDEAEPDAEGTEEKEQSPASSSSFVDVMEPIDLFQVGLTVLSTCVGGLIGLEAGERCFDGVFGDRQQQREAKDYRLLGLPGGRCHATTAEILSQYVKESEKVVSLDEYVRESEKSLSTSGGRSSPRASSSDTTDEGGAQATGGSLSSGEKEVIEDCVSTAATTTSSSTSSWVREFDDSGPSSGCSGCQVAARLRFIDLSSAMERIGAERGLFLEGADVLPFTIPEGGRAGRSGAPGAGLAKERMILSKL
ncbi:unnamed protein product [Amoebophrya sp. A120]|nr:unnamed protein product [Amoebophrya sp. A120]|eukprot:GSA120T00021569001.1